MSVTNVRWSATAGDSSMVISVSTMAILTHLLLSVVERERVIIAAGQLAS